MNFMCPNTQTAPPPGVMAGGPKRVYQEIAREPPEFISTSATDAAAVRYLNDLFQRAAREGVSDVHLEERDDICLIRFRRHGEMEDIDRAPMQYARDFDAKIRMKCKLSLEERMIPLDGKFRFAVDEREVDVRVSILPLSHGQSIVCRLLDHQVNLISLDEIAMPDPVRAQIRHLVEQPQGLFLVTGPTGSGKTTTLYGILQYLNTPTIKILTVEDPVEYRIASINQAQVNQKLTFASALKSMLRQDPDIILVGEIRDSDTARIATQAALTGHVVLSTLHANTALLTLNRLLDLDVDPHALSAAISGFMAQRLVRQLCPHCRQSVALDEFAIKQMLHAGIPEARLADRPAIYQPGRCHQCRDGWSCRLPVIELVVATPAVRSAVESSDLKMLERAARAQPQYRSLGQHAMELVLEGKTSLAEAMAVTGSALVQLDDFEQHCRC